MLKIKKIVDMFAKGKHIRLYDVEPMQWISDGAAFYPLEGVPRFNEFTLRKTYDIDDKVLILTENALPEALCFEDASVEENVVLPDKIQLQPHGEATTSFRTQNGVTFVKSRYMDKISANEDTMIYERVSRDGYIYLAAKEGMLVKALILPMICPSKDYISDAEELVQVLRQTYNNENSRE